MKKTTSGFTIVELLIVIVVIAILAAISIVAYNGIQSRGTDAANLSNANAIHKAIKLYQIDNNGEPPICADGPGAACTFASIRGELVPEYASSLEDDTDSTYSYRYVGAIAYDGAWSLRIYKRQIAGYCKTGVYPASLDTWWGGAPKC